MYDYFSIFQNFCKKSYTFVVVCHEVMRYIAYISIYIALALCSAVAAGRDVLQLDNAVFDFGTIAEEAGVVQHVVRVRNISENPVVIVAVVASCGCTTADFARKPIKAGEESNIVVRFSPLNQAGRVFRRLVVRTSEGALEQMITVQGVVTPRPKSIEEQFPIALGAGVRIDANAHSFGYVEHGKPIYSTFEIVNTSRRTVAIGLIPSVSSRSLDIRAPQSVAAGERATIEFGYRLPEKCSIYGTLKDVVEVYVDGNKSDIPLIINAIAIDSRDLFTDIEEPKGELSDNFIKFERVFASAKGAVRRVTICNKGASPLVIRRVESEGGFFESALSGDKVLRTGECRECVVRLAPPSDMLGAVSGRLKIVTNDPRRPMLSIRVTAIIER